MFTTYLRIVYRYCSKWDHNHLEKNDLLTEKQKSCHRNRGTKEQLLSDKAVVKNCRRRKVWLSMVWIDYRKDYSMVPHLWIKKSMEMCGVADNIFHLLSKSMESWQTILMSGNEELTRVNVQRGIFLGDSFIFCNWSNSLKSCPSKSKYRISTWKRAAQEDQLPSLHGWFEALRE